MSGDKANIDRDEWIGEQKTTLFGVTKSAFKEKEKTPGTKALPIHEDTFERIKELCAAFRHFRPPVDMPEMVSAMAEFVMRDPTLTARLDEIVIVLRQEALEATKAALTKGTNPSGV